MSCPSGVHRKKRLVFSCAAVVERDGTRFVRVSYAHGALREWYANGPLGAESGFDLAARPSAGSGPLMLSLAVSASRVARLGAARGRGVCRDADKRHDCRSGGRSSRIFGQGGHE